MVQRVAPGQAIPKDWPKAQDWNDIGEAAEVYQREKRTRDGAQFKPLVLATDLVWCQNNTGDREAGEVLECGEYLLADIDPMALWFAGQAPTDPVRDSTHGILRVACKSGKLERVQVSGVVRAWVDVIDEDHNFADAKAGSHVLESNERRGPHKIVYKPGGTGELECVVLLYADLRDDIVAECYALDDVCATDEGGTGTGSESQSVQVYEFRILPYCELIDPPPTVTNPKNHRGPAGSLLTVVRKECPGAAVEWQIVDVELRKLCVVNGIKKDEYGTSGGSGCIKFGSVVLGSEWCPADEPDQACELFTYGPCDVAVTCTDLTWEILVSNCCDVAGTGTGT